jgi:hypothetical protein
MYVAEVKIRSMPAMPEGADTVARSIPLLSVVPYEGAIWTNDDEMVTWAPGTGFPLKSTTMVICPCSPAVKAEGNTVPVTSRFSYSGAPYTGQAVRSTNRNNRYVPGFCQKNPFIHHHISIVRKDKKIEIFFGLMFSGRFSSVKSSMKIGNGKIENIPVRLQRIHRPP